MKPFIVHVGKSFFLLAAPLLINISSTWAANKAAKTPTVIRVGPSCGKSGAIITVTGTNLKEISSITINKKVAAISANKSTSLKIKVPPKLKDGFTSITFKPKSGKNLTSLFRVNCSTGITFKESIASKSSTVIQKEGGRVSATISKGSTVSLDIPADALSGSLPISITPLVQVAGLGFSQGILAGAKFEPDGTQFNKPVKVTLTLPSTPKGSLIGFQFRGSDNNFTLVPVQVNGNSVTFNITHFSGAGVAPVSEADFVAVVQPLLNSLGVLPVSQLDNLVDIFNGFIGKFPDLCSNQASLCQLVQKKAEESIKARIKTLCPSDLKGALPSVSETTAFELINISADAQLFAVDDSGSLECAEEISKRVLEGAIDDALRLPGIERINRIIELSSKFQGFGFLQLVQRASDGLLLVATEAVRLAEVFCASDTSTAMNFALLVENLFTVGVLNSTSLANRLKDVYPLCKSGLLVNPNNATISPGTQLTLVATPVNFFNSLLVWNVERSSRIDSSGTDPEITQEGVLTAGTRGGIYEVNAQSRNTFSVVGKTFITVADILNVAISPTFDVALQRGGQQQFFGNVDIVGPFSSGVNWSATGGTISREGLYTAGQVLGTFEIKATSAEKPSKFATRSIRIVNPPVPELVFARTCGAVVSRFATTLVSVGGGMSAFGGVSPVIASVGSCTGGAVCSASSNSFSGSANIALLGIGTYGVSGSIKDGAGQTVTGSLIVSVSSVTLPPGGTTQEELIRRVSAIVSPSGCQSFSVSIDGGSIG